MTISGRQVEIARKLTLEEAQEAAAGKEDAFVKLGDGQVRFLELDAEKMGDFFTNETNKATFDCVWISEAMSHLPNKELFFRNAEKLLNPGGKLVIADWFKAEGLTSAQMDADIKPIEGQYLLMSDNILRLTECLQMGCCFHPSAPKRITSNMRLVRD